MPLKIFNSLTKQKEEFQPLKKGEVRMYVCGPTVYDEPHIGHLRSAFCFEVMRRHLENSGYKVTFVRNVTDVDDKIIDKARESNPENLLAEVARVSEKYHRAYLSDLEALGIKSPSQEPKATQHIGEMLALIQKLIQKNAAYAVGADVYFDVNAFQGYGKLSHQNKDAMMQGVRIDKNEKKKNPLDFALWKGAKEGEPAWDSPWGKGRPGWHIECSAMSMKYLGETFDIHGGGRDLIFPHHENEVAQSEAVTGTTFAKTWIHHGLITINEQKMSKSLKNFVSLKTIREKYGDHGAEELKFLFLGTHYTAPLDFSEEHMKMQRAIRTKFVNVILAGGENGSADKYKAAFKDAMDDNFNTPQAIAVMHELASVPGSGNTMKEFFEALGLGYQDAFVGGEEAEKLKVEYDKAAQAKDYASKDRIRKMMQEKYGLKAQDSKDGRAQWLKAS